MITQKKQLVLFLITTAVAEKTFGFLLFLKSFQRTLFLAIQRDKFRRIPNLQYLTVR